MKKLGLSALIVFALFCITHSLHAAAPSSAVQHTPGEINYQGKLVKTDGNLVADGAYTLAIRLYRVSTAGTAVWGGQYVTYVKDGYFNLMLGGAAGSSVSPTPTYAHNALWRALWPDSAISSDQKNSLYLGVTPVSGVAAQLTYGTEISPRQNLLAAPYAFRAQTAEYANQAYAGFTVAGAIAAGFDPNDPAIAFRTYKSGTAPFLDIGVNGSGETKLQSATTRVNSGVFQVSSGTQSFTAGAGNFTVNSGAGNIAMGGNNATINMGGSVTISGAGTAGTTVGTTSRPLTLQGNQVKGRNELLWNKVSNTDANEKPFIVEQFSATMSSGDTAVYIDLGRPVRDYSAMVVGWRTGNGVITHQLEAVFTAVDGNWKVKIKRSPSTGAAGYTVTILFINKLMITDPRTVYAEG